MKPLVPPSNLRWLPQDYLTRDLSDPDRIYHKADPDHIINGIVRKRMREELEPTDHGTRADERTASPFKNTLKYIPGVSAPLPVTQYIVDILRMRALITAAKMLSRQFSLDMTIDWKNELAVKHIWFPENRASKMEVRPGLPPPPKKRPAWLQRIDLVLDLMEWPESVLRMLRERGADPTPILSKLKKMKAGLYDRKSPWITTP